jgi:hypothetical protein
MAIAGSPSAVFCLAGEFAFRSFPFSALVVGFVIFLKADELLEQPTSPDHWHYDWA